MRNPGRVLHGRASCALPTLFALCAVVATGLSPRQPGRAMGVVAADGAPPANAAALRGQGKLAFAWQGRLYVLNGATGRLHAMSPPGMALDPVWSPDGAWLAYLRLTDPGTLQGTLWVVRSDGRDAQRVLPPDMQVSSFAWSPTADVLVALASPGATQPAGLCVAPIGSGAGGRVGPARGLVPRGGWAGSFAWSPDGSRLAFDTGSRRHPGADELDVISSKGGAARTVFATRVAHGVDTGIIVAGWWPGGRGLLFWLDPYHSGSIAADGMALLSLPLATRRPRTLAWTLGYRDFLAWAPGGRRLVLVAGRGRAVYGHKALALCDMPRGTCRRLLRRRGVVSLDPAWSPHGRRIAFVEARDLGDVEGFNTDRGLLSWIGSRHLWVAGPDGSGGHLLRAAGGGVYNPRWSRDGTHLLYVRDNAIWLVPAKGGAAVQVARLFSTPGLPAYQNPPGTLFWRLFYYGHVAWSSLFDWYSL